MTRGPGRRTPWALLAVLSCLLLATPAVAALPYDTAIRIGAASPRATAIQVSRALYPGGGAGAVVLAREDTFPDALGAAALTTDVDGPLLLTPPDQLTADTRAEIDRLLVDGGTVYLLGGTAALGPSVERVLDDAGYRTPRFPGQDRVQTAAMIARFVGAGPGDEVLLVRASGSPDLEQGWVDSVSCGGWAARSGTPILLTATASPTVATESLDTMASLGIRRVHVCGGALAVPEAQLDQLRGAGYAVERHAGADRAATAVAVARELWNVARRDGHTFLLVPGYGTRFGFGLVAAPLAAALDAPILLVDRDAPTSCADPVAGATLCLLDTGSAGADGLVAVGGTGVVSDDVLLTAAKVADLPRDDQPPAVPGGLAAVDRPEDDGTVLDVSWNASAGESGPVTYTLYVQGPGSDDQQVTTDQTSLVVSGLTAGTGYTLTVDARDAFGNRSAPSSAVAATPTDEVPASPGSLGPTVATRPAGGVSVSWIAAPEDDVVGYRLQRLNAGDLITTDCDPDNNTFPQAWEDVTGSIITTTTYVDTGTTSGTDYCYRYTPVDDTGNSPGFSMPNGPVEAG